MAKIKISDLEGGYIEKEENPSWCETCSKELVNPDEIAIYGDEHVCNGTH